MAHSEVYPEQWGVAAESVDFFDIKSDVEALLALAGNKSEIIFRASEHPALQPGQSAEIFRNDEVIGVVGKLHPRIAKQYDLKRATYLFELDADKTLASQAPIAESISKFPTIRRDVSVIVDEEVLARDLVSVIELSSPELIQGVRIFDIYKGQGIEAGRKSVAIGLILQETSRTLTDDDADGVMAAVIKQLSDQFAAELRD
jgi:phenylalanyl-tRNA synthetase beta chain